MAKWGKASGPPGKLTAEPQKDAGVDRFLAPGLEHRPFTDDEIKEAFDCFDLDNNRFVGAMEIKHILEVIGEEVQEAEIDEMIRICDTDGDGQVTFDEFFKLMTQPPPMLPPAGTTGGRGPMKYGRKVDADDSLRATGSSGKDGAMPTDSSQFRKVSVEQMVRKLSGGLTSIKPNQIKKIYKRFREIDTDGSGSIDYSEFVAALEIEKNNTSMMMFNVFDSDGSKSIELKEFIVMLSRYTSASRTEKLKFAFMMFDEDASGFIERSELINMLQASFIVEDLSIEELEKRADKVFEFLDKGRNDSISYDEFLKLQKTGFVYPMEPDKRSMAGSEASMNAYRG